MREIREIIADTLIGPNSGGPEREAFEHMDDYEIANLIIEALNKAGYHIVRKPSAG